MLLVDPVVDDRDLDAVAASAGQAGERRPSEHGRSYV
jgi:hypothetical protein